MANKKLKILLNILLAACLVVLGVSVFQLARTGLEYKKGSDEYEKLAEEYVTPEVAEDGEKFIALDYDALKGINSDFVGWLEIADTGISYPVVYRAGDNDTYLVRTFEGQNNGAGAIFADGRVAGDLTAPHTILYGHNMKNNTMFADLPKFLNAEYAAGHPIIRIYTPNGVYHYRVLGARETTVEDGVYRLWFEGGEDFSAWAGSLGAPAGATNILTLSTCTNVEDDGRYVAYAVLEGVTEAGTGPPATMTPPADA